MAINDVFINRFGRLRSGWRFAIFAVAFICLTAIASGMASSILFTGMGIGSPPPIFLAITDLAALTVAVIVGWLLGRYLEGLPFRALGVAPQGSWLVHFAIGVLVGAASLIVAVALAIVGGGLKFLLGTADALSVAGSMATSAGVFLIAGAFEEALFRGYVFQTFSRAGLAWLAILITSCFFGVVHLGNQNAGLVSTVNTILAGIWLSAAYLKTRDLWFPVGVHVAWNWMQGAIFGVEVSGMKEMNPAPLLREIDLGPAWLTGGDYGLEAGIACTVSLVISTVAICLLPWPAPEKDLYALTSTESAESRV